MIEFNVYILQIWELKFKQMKLFFQNLIGNLLSSLLLPLHEMFSSTTLNICLLDSSEDLKIGQQLKKRGGGGDALQGCSTWEGSRFTSENLPEYTEHGLTLVDHSTKTLFITRSTFDIIQSTSAQRTYSGTTCPEIKIQEVQGITSTDILFEKVPQEVLTITLRLEPLLELKLKQK